MPAGCKANGRGAEVMDVLPVSLDGVFAYPGLVLAKAWHVSLQTSGSDRGTLAVSDFARCLPLQVAGPFFLSCVSCTVNFSIPQLLVPKILKSFTLKKGFCS